MIIGANAHKRRCVARRQTTGRAPQDENGANVRNFGPCAVDRIFVRYADSQIRKPVAIEVARSERGPKMIARPGRR